MSVPPAQEARADDTYEVVIANGRLVDGCGNPWYRADIGIRGGVIASIAPAGTLAGRLRVDADDRYVVPGFVDPHTHSDLTILAYRDAESAARQGVTTHVIGNCGMSPAPVADGHLADIRRFWHGMGDNPLLTWQWRSFGEYLDLVGAGGIGINIVPLVGHGALRVAAMGFDQRKPSPGEFTVMERLLDQSMAEGAVGLSSGLVYPPGCYADTDEISALCEVAAAYHGVYTTHVRGERESILQGVAEAIAIGQRAGLPVHLSHNAPKWGAQGTATKNLGLAESARWGGHDVTIDNDVHTDLAVKLCDALPQPLLRLARRDLLDVLRNPEGRNQLRADVEADRLPGAGFTGLLKHRAYERIVVFCAPGQPDLVGITISEIAASRGVDPFDAYLDVILQTDGEAVGIFDYIGADDILSLLRHPLEMCCSDGYVSAPCAELDDVEPSAGAWSMYMPCSYGEYPGILERYVREDMALTLQECIRKMTSFPAQRFGLHDRGVLRPSLAADIVVLDLENIRDRATNRNPLRAPFENVPHRYPEGIDFVFVNGVAVVHEGAHTGARPGLVLRRHRTGNGALAS